MANPGPTKATGSYIEENAAKPTGGRLTAAEIHHYIKEEFGKDYHSDHIYTLLKKKWDFRGSLPAPDTLNSQAPLRKILKKSK
ncbi:helix-turn-helix domain-containing protein [Vibrio aerogenes]|uniref:helix-turn-helix domain-containing protein n=1 Tax=Vibrio aerogenes TaxID=92172 RepID=UPI001FE81CF3|nr:winged helix-turn-helix domain-containing protein [Vibrio aerogenes]